jgi:RNA polymerase sigma factor (sigma-70 family)
MSPPVDPHLLRILEQVGQGQLSALNPIVDEMDPYLLRVARNEVPREHRHRLPYDDVVQQSWLIGCETIARFAGQTLAALRGWMAAIVRGVVRQWVRSVEAWKRGRAQVISLELSGSAVAAFVDPRAVQPWAAAMARENIQTVADVLGQMPFYRRQWIVWRLNETPLDEIAQQLGISFATARKRMQTAVAQFKQIILKFQASRSVVPA